MTHKGSSNEKCKIKVSKKFDIQGISIGIGYFPLGLRVGFMSRGPRDHGQYILDPILRPWT